MYTCWYMILGTSSDRPTLTNMTKLVIRAIRALLYSVCRCLLYLLVHIVVKAMQVQIDVDADPERSRAPTIASAAQEAEHAAAFAPVHGYTTETLLRDKRFKVCDVHLHIHVLLVCMRQQQACICTMKTK